MEDEARFETIKEAPLNLGKVYIFNWFILDLPARIDFENYSTIVIWCERFGEFITAAQYS
ncbi:DM13 domain-containing protein [Cognatiyoonia sp.]|uniref:DM13 domain-containing protein n=1 Tax=Cognatiyoonia sp. TaxID=2211652 RepID=UPI003F699701